MRNGRKCSEQTKKILSDKRKAWLRNNPDKHPWRNKDKHQSVPCQKMKDFLKSLNINFIEEFDPQIPDRYFSVDIALPDKKIAIEINGNQHYENTGILKPYYQERHNLLVTHGWIVYEIHYSMCFNIEKLTKFSEILQNNIVVSNFDYGNYTPPSKKEKPIKIPRIRKEKVVKIPKLPKPISYCECGNRKTYISTQCDTCYRIRSRKVIRPSKEELIELLNKLPVVQVGKIFNVSDNAIRKWKRAYSIE